MELFHLTAAIPATVVRVVASTQDLNYILNKRDYDIVSSFLTLVFYGVKAQTSKESSPPVNSETFKTRIRYASCIEILTLKS